MSWHVKPWAAFKLHDFTPTKSFDWRPVLAWRTQPSVGGVHQHVRSHLWHQTDFQRAKYTELWLTPPPRYKACHDVTLETRRTCCAAFNKGTTMKKQKQKKLVLDVCCSRHQCKTSAEVVLKMTQYHMLLSMLRPLSLTVTSLALFKQISPI